MTGSFCRHNRPTDKCSICSRELDQRLREQAPIKYVTVRKPGTTSTPRYAARDQREHAERIREVQLHQPRRHAQARARHGRRLPQPAGPGSPRHRRCGTAGGGADRRGRAPRAARAAPRHRRDREPRRRDLARVPDRARARAGGRPHRGAAELGGEGPVRAPRGQAARRQRVPRVGGPRRLADGRVHGRGELDAGAPLRPRVRAPLAAGLRPHRALRAAHHARRRGPLPARGGVAALRRGRSRDARRQAPVRLGRPDAARAPREGVRARRPTCRSPRSTMAWRSGARPASTWT